MQQLLYQSEDLRQIKNEWRRFWFNDQPSHLTPERIHGGILLAVDSGTVESVGREDRSAGRCLASGSCLLLSAVPLSGLTHWPRSARLRLTGNS